MNLTDKPIKDRAILVAQYFIWKSKIDPKETGLGKLKLQKLLYYAQAWNLVLNKEKLFEDEIEAWVQGPAVPKVYRAFKNFNFENPDIEFNEEQFDIFSDKERQLMDEVWRVYGKFDGSYLVTLTHNELPWQKARGNMDETKPSQNIISTDDMRQYYAKIATAQETPK
ncbi:MAG: hypothetical protein A2445_01265 [Candidatus Jacksonbacteria bacterium RIFOXYC2_FULL_44_29]|nr:MAG: hypothetical protein UW45_C0013G0016 [Parcubacteria group bacterium GW2011_GWC2_44_22]OGY74966.1 MAG: hypothetical protein A2240_05295 [Candidatus Jacksonbacteria bacterium RIFOXYA2_FULL_43_12]OGY76519.1 MAG: hypothetical protein A2295_02080 [Candidatus Jacksonbacteria bacterium RIFOXYB2_FULL_44_15]OGY78499.1 MAG: hypothetical protein A2445_01265 [Candidatus Jacksonbacteria bacterium RIFOXYC2_FULL_44_29]OGY81156.1 MAG: hypothetical protein A2550_01660 [Candidatus Jacksonbacteria bacteri